MVREPFATWFQFVTTHFGDVNSGFAYEAQLYIGSLQSLLKLLDMSLA